MWYKFPVFLVYFTLTWMLNSSSSVVSHIYLWSIGNILSVMFCFFYAKHRSMSLNIPEHNTEIICGSFSDTKRRETMRQCKREGIRKRVSWLLQFIFFFASVSFQKLFWKLSHQVIPEYSTSWSLINIFYKL